ncbi:TetR/AcrR family transcriptional regulator [Psychrosphaera sp. 1_MG-2023]|nr:TetR/AcrR family transcriptional regulator [Psychrosphaera sp. 1_MG-2023]MDO6721488.1 TetR/AcrR family transcriptional regulator [Psychrosphaera sp. 1_MG-2023]
MTLCNSLGNCPEKSNSKQDDILCAAISEFAKFGVLGSTMEHIAKRAQVSKRTLYKNYANKDELFDAVIDLQLGTISRLTECPYQMDIPMHEQLRKLAYQAIKLTNNEDYLTLSRIVIIESMRSKEAADKVNSKFKDCEKGMSGWFSTAERAGALEGIPAKTAATMFYGSLKQLVYWERAIKWQPERTEEELSVMVEQVCSVFAKGFSSTN